MGDMVSVGDGHACQHLSSVDGRDTRSGSNFADCWNIPDSDVTAEPHDAHSDVTADQYDTTYDSANSSDDPPSTSNNDDHDARLGRRRFLTAEIALSEPGTEVSAEATPSAGHFLRGPRRDKPSPWAGNLGSRRGGGDGGDHEDIHMIERAGRLSLWDGSGQFPLGQVRSMGIGAN
jgi:hypothetical protein